jgi:hypothetical protein
MRHRAGERQQVLHHRARPERLDLDRAEPQARGAQPRHDLAQLAAVAHQHRDARVGLRRPRVRDEVDHARRLARVIAGDERMHHDRIARQRRVHRGRRRVAHCARAHVLAPGHDLPERRIYPFDDARLRSEVGGQADRRQRDAADPRVLPGA